MLLTCHFIGYTREFVFGSNNRVICWIKLKLDKISFGELDDAGAKRVTSQADSDGLGDGV